VLPGCHLSSNSMDVINHSANPWIAEAVELPGAITSNTQDACSHELSEICRNCGLRKSNLGKDVTLTLLLYGNELAIRFVYQCS
jgi:hypothetical protein